jgi:hypothetical protein
MVAGFWEGQTMKYPMFDGTFVHIRRGNQIAGDIIWVADHGAFHPDGFLPGITKEQSATHNASFSTTFIEGLKTCAIGQGNNFYFKEIAGDPDIAITTWSGAEVAIIRRKDTRFLKFGRTFKVKLPSKNSDNQSCWVERTA